MGVAGVVPGSGQAATRYPRSTSGSPTAASSQSRTAATRDGRPVSPREQDGLGVEGLFARIEEELASAASGRDYLTAHFDAAEARPEGLPAAVTSCVGACCGVPGVCGVGTARRFGREAVPWMLLPRMRARTRLPSV